MIYRRLTVEEHRERAEMLRKTTKPHLKRPASMLARARTSAGFQYCREVMAHIHARKWEHDDRFRTARERQSSGFAGNKNRRLNHSSIYTSDYKLVPLIAYNHSIARLTNVDPLCLPSVLRLQENISFVFQDTNSHPHNRH
jgi:hypothetical protein